MLKKSLIGSIVLVFTILFVLAGCGTLDLVSVHKVGYFADRPCIFSPKGCENANFKVVCP
jgi:hypothetical protein